MRRSTTIYPLYAFSLIPAAWIVFGSSKMNEVLPSGVINHSNGTSRINGPSPKNGPFSIAMFDFWMVTTIDSDHQHVLTWKKRPLFVFSRKVFKKKRWGCHHPYWNWSVLLQLKIHFGKNTSQRISYWQDDSPSFQSIHRSS